MPSGDAARCRLRLKLPDGSELEAEGEEAFVKDARRQFLESAERGDPPARGRPAMPAEAALGAPRIAWPAILEIRGNVLQLRGKLPGGRTHREASLLLLAGAQRLLSQAKPTATQLAKWLRTSGYPVARVDRALQDAVSQGDLLPSGSRRSRRYELTSAGRLKALLLAEELTRLVQP